jgi:hypothetical protein
MTVIMNLGQRLAVLAGITAIAFIGVSCQGSSPTAAANSKNTSADNAELFTIPPDQMSHVQVLTVQPTTLTRSMRLTGAVA